MKKNDDIHPFLMFVLVTVMMVGIITSGVGIAKGIEYIYKQNSKISRIDYLNDERDRLNQLANDNDRRIDVLEGSEQTDRDFISKHFKKEWDAEHPVNYINWTSAPMVTP